MQDNLILEILCCTILMSKGGVDEYGFHFVQSCRSWYLLCFVFVVWCFVNIMRICVMFQPLVACFILSKSPLFNLFSSLPACIISLPGKCWMLLWKHACKKGVWVMFSAKSKLFKLLNIYVKYVFIWVTRILTICKAVFKVLIIATNMLIGQSLSKFINRRMIPSIK